MKLSDFVAGFIANLGIKHVFGVSGGGSQHLNDSFGHHERLKYVATHHEQAAAMAAEAYARLTGIGCCCVTTGPGTTNAITGAACAWVDSIPVLFISGQVTRNTMLEGTGLRQRGVQETDIVTLVRPITKHAIVVRDPEQILVELQRAVHIAKSGRPGPVWLDIPLDVQSAQIDPENLLDFTPWSNDVDVRDACDATAKMLERAERPVLIVGNGARGADIWVLASHLEIPVITSWTGGDLIADHHFHIGHCGMFGDRASNFAVQNADLLLVIGSRLSYPQTGHDLKAFAPNARIIMVDADYHEIRKFLPQIELSVEADAKRFVNDLLETPYHGKHIAWLAKCLAWKLQYPVVLPEYRQEKAVNSFYFVEALSARLPEDATVALDMGAAFTCTFQAAKMKQGQRWITASGHAPMGWGLPGAIGAAFATGRKVICIVGDGALQMNLQELATIAHHQLPILIFVLCNGGYLTMKHSQQSNFGRFAGADKSDLTFPNLMLLARAYDIAHVAVPTTHRLNHMLDGILAEDGPLLVEIQMDEMQPLVPRVQSRKLADGTLSAAPLHDMYPHLHADELAEQMSHG